MLFEILLFFLSAFLTYYFQRLSNADRIYFEKRKIKYKPRTYSLSNFIGIIFNRFTAIEFANRSYSTFPDEPIYGVADFNKKRYAVRDLEIIKKIGIRDFDHFEDHESFVDEKADKLWGNTIFLMKGQKWRQMRATLSPAFTGRKMRQMFELILVCVEDTIQHHKKKCDTAEGLNVEMKDLFTRYTNDVIASCAFGLKVDSFAEPENQFFLDGKKISNFFGPLQVLKILLFVLFPKVAHLLNLKIANTEKFSDMVLNTMEYRSNNNIYRPDMINTMMQVRTGSLKHELEEKSKKSDEGYSTVEESEVGKKAVTRVWNNDELVAQCFIFFVAGFETSSTLLTFATYELVANADIQHKLYEEIVMTNKQLDGKRIDYETLQKMKFLDQFISEVLRKWPPFLQLERECVDNYVVDDGQNLNFIIEKGSVVHVPIYNLQHDPKYYVNPEKFDPDRFSEVNKTKIVPGSYIPFGIGPRSCIGSRFALMEIKAILYYLLLNFSLNANDKTDIPFKLKKSPISFVMKNGMHVELRPRAPK